MSEVDIGLTSPDYFTVLMRSKIGSASAWRDILLARRKVKGEEAVTMGIVDSTRTIVKRAWLKLWCALGSNW